MIFYSFTTFLINLNYMILKHSIISIFYCSIVEYVALYCMILYYDTYINTTLIKEPDNPHMSTSSNKHKADVNMGWESKERDRI